MTLKTKNLIKNFWAVIKHFSTMIKYFSTVKGENFDEPG